MAAASIKREDMPQSLQQRADMNIMPYNLINVPAILGRAFVMEVALYSIHFILPLLTHSYAAARPRSEGK